MKLLRVPLLFLLGLSCFLSIAQSTHPLETVIQRGHSRQITCASYSPDGKYVATGSADNSVKIWNVASGKEIRSFGQHTGSLRSVQFSPDGTKIISTATDNKIYVFETISGNVLNTFSIPEEEIDRACFSPDGTQIMVSSTRDKYWVWDLATLELKGAFKKSYQVHINPTWFHASGAKFIAAHNYKDVYLMNAGDKSTDTLVLPFDKASHFSFSPDGKKLAIGSTKLFTEVFDVEKGKMIARLENDPSQKCDGCNTQVRYSPKGKYLVTGTKKTGVHVWNANSQKRIYNLKLEKKRVRHLLFSLDERYLLVSNREQLTVFDLKTGKQQLHLKSPWLNKYEPVFSPDGKNLLVAGSNHVAEIWSLSSKRKVKLLRGYSNSKVHNGLDLSETSWTDQTILNQIRMKSAAILSPDGKSFLKGNMDSTVVMVDLATGKVKQRFLGHHKIVYAFDFSSDGTRIATAGGDKFIKIWDPKTGKEVRTLKGHRDLIFDVRFSSDGQQLLSASWDGSIRLWDVVTGKELKYLPFGKTSPYVIGFTPNDLYTLVADLGKSLKLYEMDTGGEFRSIVGHNGIVGAFDFGPDGKSILTAGWDGKAKVWDFLTGMLVQKFSGHEGKVTSSEWNPKGGQVATGGSDRKIYLWNPITGKATDTLLGHSSAVTSLQYTQDAKRLLSCDVNGVVKLWDLKTNKELYSYMQMDVNNWLVTNPEGYFDGTQKALKLVNYVSGMEVVPIGSLFEKYYTPGLLKRIMKGEEFQPTGFNLEETIKSAPKVKLSFTDLNSRSVNAQVDSVYAVREKILPLNVSIAGEKSNGYEARIYNNGKLILTEKMSNELVFRGGSDRTSKTFEISLVGGDNEISVVVLNEERVESPAVSVNVNYDGKRALTDLYILTIGINEYKNPNYHLNYAVNDANALLKTISKGTKNLFSSVKEYTFRDEKANKKEIFEALNEIAKDIGPEDVFLFYYAGHGVFNIEPGADPEFYLVTVDILNLYGDTEKIKSKAISATEILEFSKKISAQKQVFVLDACQSGGAVKAFAQRGAGREKALAQLARSSGTFFLTASQDSQFANEAGNLNHGLFTYAILEALTGKEGVSSDKKITINELKGYVEERVPELSQEHHGSAQYPTSYSFGQDFPIVLVK